MPSTAGALRRASRERGFVVGLKVENPSPAVEDNHTGKR